MLAVADSAVGSFHALFLSENILSSVAKPLTVKHWLKVMWNEFLFEEMLDDNFGLDVLTTATGQLPFVPLQLGWKKEVSEVLGLYEELNLPIFQR